MSNGEPLFPGRTERDELVKIFKVLGTPTPEIWPDLTSMPQYEAGGTWPAYPAQNLKDIARKLDGDGVDLLTRMLQYDPKKRISAVEALKHPYFDSLRPNVNDRK